MNILFYMIPKSKVQCVYSNNSVRQVLERMREYSYPSIPLLDKDGYYVGTISEGDLLWYIKDHNMNLEECENASILDVVRRKDNNTITIDGNMEDLIFLAEKQNFIPVKDDRGFFIGIIKRKDILAYLATKSIKK